MTYADLTDKRLRWMRRLKLYWTIIALVNLGFCVLDVYLWGLAGVLFAFPFFTLVPISGAVVWICDAYVVKVPR